MCNHLFFESCPHSIKIKIRVANYFLHKKSQEIALGNMTNVIVANCNIVPTGKGWHKGLQYLARIQDRYP